MRPRVAFVFLGLLAVVVTAAPAAGPAAPVRAEGAKSLAELRAQLAAFLDAPRFQPAQWGVKVVSLDSGRVLFERGANLRLSPASNSKLYPAALALDRLGGDFRIRTPLLGRGRVTAAGVLQGDLVVAGRGDPSWNPRREKQEFWTAFEPFVAALRQAGVKQVTGDIIADATHLHALPHGPGWTADDLNDYYGAELSAVSLEENHVDLRVTPASRSGAACAVEILSPCTGLELDNRVTTGVAESPRELSVLRLPGEQRVTLFGSLPVGGEAELTSATVPRPAGWFARGLKEALGRAGIRVAGEARSVRWPEAPVDVAGAVVLGEVVSPPLRELTSVMLKVSQNLRTELLFALIGEQSRRPDTPVWRTADELALAELETFLRAHHLRPEDVRFDEGSGLSRNNLTSAAALVELLRFMATHREREAFMSALPVAGVDGTLRKRLKGTPAEGNVQAKTGTLRWANALSGYVTTAAGERLAFSLILNRHVPAPDHRSSEELDALAVMLAASQARD